MTRAPLACSAATVVAPLVSQSMSKTDALTVVSTVPLSCHCQSVPFGGAHQLGADVGAGIRRGRGW